MKNKGYTFIEIMASVLLIGFIGAGISQVIHRQASLSEHLQNRITALNHANTVAERLRNIVDLDGVYIKCTLIPEEVTRVDENKDKSYLDRWEWDAGNGFVCPDEIFINIYDGVYVERDVVYSYDFNTTIASRSPNGFGSVPTTVQQVQDVCNVFGQELQNEVITYRVWLADMSAKNNHVTNSLGQYLYADEAVAALAGVDHKPLKVDFAAAMSNVKLENNNTVARIQDPLVGPYSRHVGVGEIWVTVTVSGGPTGNEFSEELTFFLCPFVFVDMPRF